MLGFNSDHWRRNTFYYLDYLYSDNYQHLFWYCGDTEDNYIPLEELCHLRHVKAAQWRYFIEMLLLYSVLPVAPEVANCIPNSLQVHVAISILWIYGKKFQLAVLNVGKPKIPCFRSCNMSSSGTLMNPARLNLMS